VSVDESRKDEMVGGVDRLAGLVFRFDFAAWADGDNRVAGYRDCSVVVDRAWAVHGDYHAAGDQQISGLFSGLGEKEKWIETEKGQ
jgi:hypothetical protein